MVHSVILNGCIWQNHFKNMRHNIIFSRIFDKQICLGCARFPEIFQNFSELQILWSLYSVVFHALTLKLPIQTSLSVVPNLPVYLSVHEKRPNFRKTSTPLENTFEENS